VIAYCSGFVGLQHYSTNGTGAVSPQLPAGTVAQFPWCAAQRPNPMDRFASPPASHVGARLPAQGSNLRVLRSIVLGQPAESLVGFPFINVATDVNNVQTFYGQPGGGGMPGPEFSIWFTESEDPSWSFWFPAWTAGTVQPLVRGLPLGGSMAIPADVPIPQTAKHLVVVGHYIQAAVSGSLPLANLNGVPRIIVPCTLCVDV
jgi:hypothetical protein